jgi:pyruvate formate lyase activating enzyme
MVFSPFLDVDIPVTFRDHPDTQSAVLYTEITLCNLNCYQCHNRCAYREKKEKITYQKLKEKLSMLRLLGVELVIISGGEPTLEKNLKEGLKFIKSLGFPVRVDTNGTNSETVHELIEEKLVDGFAVDVKIPIKDEYTPQERERFKTILFSNSNLDDAVVYDYSKKLKITIGIIRKYSLPYTIFRTVEYPLLSSQDKNQIRKLLESLPHQFNPFYPVEE